MEEFQAVRGAFFSLEYRATNEIDIEESWSRNMGVRERMPRISF
jgi:hypothetical protein